MKDVYTALYPNEQVAKGKCSVNWFRKFLEGFLSSTPYFGYIGLM
jgi:hypothetical protein